MVLSTVNCNTPEEEQENNQTDQEPQQLCSFNSLGLLGKLTAAIALSAIPIGLLIGCSNAINHNDFPEDHIV